MTLDLAVLKDSRMWINETLLSEQQICNSFFSQRDELLCHAAFVRWVGGSTKDGWLQSAKRAENDLMEKYYI